jgi:hypothetical protein
MREHQLAAALGILLVTRAFAPGCGAGADGSGSSGDGGQAGQIAFGGSSGATDGAADHAGGASASGGTGGTSLGGSAGADAGGADGSAASGATGGSDGGMPCEDPGPEPNDSIVLATSACGVPTCELGDCDSDGSQGYGGKRPPITGVVGPGDSDNYGLCWVDPAAKTEQYGFRLCMFVACVKGASQVSACPNGLALDQEGAPGCCITAPGEVSITYDCVGSLNDEDSARIVVRVDEATACTPYSIDYHF